MSIPITGLADLGFIADRKAYTLPVNAWSDAKNVRFVEGSVYPTYGHQAVMGAPKVVPYYIHATLDSTLAPIFAYCGLSKVWATDGTTHQDITRTSGGNYTGVDTNLWSAVEFGGISILNNGVDTPQTWSPRGLATPLVNLANWPADTIATIVRSYRRFLIAMDVTKSGTRYPQLVKWSHEADPGALPSSWDETDETKDAGEYPLIDTAGPILEGLPLGDVFCIYKTDATYLMEYTGGTFVFKLPLAFKDLGILSQRAVGEWSKKHIVLTNDMNGVVNDGFQFTSFLDSKWRRTLAKKVDATNYFRSFIAINQSENEAWICFPEAGAKFATLALIVNLRTGAPTIRELPNVAHIEYNRGPSSSGTTFDSQNIPFDSMTGYFDQVIGGNNKKVLLGVVPAIGRNLLLKSEALDHGVWFNSQLTVAVDQRADPDTGAVVAEKLTPTALNTFHYLEQSRSKPASEARTYTASAKCRPNGYNFVRLQLDDTTGSNTAFAIYDIGSGTVFSSGLGGDFSNILATIEALADGFYRCGLRATTGAQASVRVQLYVFPTNNPVAYVGNGTSGIFATALQIREDTSPGPYQVTDDVAATSAFFLFDSGYDFDGTPFLGYAERTGLPVSGQNLDGSPRLDPSVTTFFQDLWPKVEMINGSTITIMAGGSMMQNDLPQYVTTAFNPAVDRFAEAFMECVYKAVRFQANDRNFWRLTEYDVNIAKIGAR